MKSKKCPVCDMEIKDAGIKVNANGREVTVCCDDCAKGQRATGAIRAGGEVIRRRP